MKKTGIVKVNLSFKNDTEAHNMAFHQMMSSASDQEAYLVNLVESDRSLLEDPETKEIYDAYIARQSGQQQVQPQTQQVQQQQVQPQQQQQVQPQHQQQVQPQHQQQVQISEEEFMTNAGLFFEPKKTIDVSNVTAETLVQSMSMVGIDSSKPDWAKKVILELHGLEELKNKHKELNDSHQQINDNIQNLPTPLLHAIDASLKGKDWREELSNFDIDYRKDFDKLDSSEKERITKRMIPDIVIPDEDTNSVQYKTAIALGKVAYNQHKKSIEEEFSKQQNLLELQNKTHASLLGNTLTKLAEEYPEFKESENVKEVKRILEEKKIMSVFYDAKGNLRPDAAEKLALAIYGKNVIERAKNITASKMANSKIASIMSQPHSRGEGTNQSTHITGNQEDAFLGKMTERALRMYEQTY